MYKRFEWLVQTPLTETSAPKVNKAQYGDGYMQTSRKGINTNLKKFGIQVKNHHDVINAVNDFLDEHAGAETFEWQHPTSGKLYLVKCFGWNVSRDSNTATISAEFEEVLL